MCVTNEMTEHGTRIKWSDIKDRIPIETVATNLLGPASKRQGSRLFWPCPFHDDHHPSFDVNMQKKLWYCRVCGIGGDTANLVMRIQKVDFSSAVRFLAYLAGESSRPNTHLVGDVMVLGKIDLRQPTSHPVAPSGLPLEEASSLVREASKRLWGVEGRDALAYLHGRGLTDETIRGHGMGWTPKVMIPTKDGDRCFQFTGVTIPWRDNDRLTRLKIRRFPFPNREPKYAEAYSDRPLIYPDPAVIRVGESLIICEGEFDAMLLGQQLPEASVITLGSASAEPTPLCSRKCSPLLAGLSHSIPIPLARRRQKSFQARAIRVAPPEKDWGDVHREGKNRIRYIWGRYLTNVQEPGRTQTERRTELSGSNVEVTYESMYEQVKRELYCDHPKVKLYRKTMINGTPMYGHQCQVCGCNIGRVKVADLNNNDKVNAIGFNEDLRRNRNHKFQVRFDELSKDWTRKHAEKQQEQRKRETESWFNNYSDYLKSEKWKSKSRLVIARDKTCQACLRNPAVQAHHKTYDNVGDEPLFDLVGICLPCHEKLHGKKFK